VEAATAAKREETVLGLWLLRLQGFLLMLQLVAILTSSSSIEMAAAGGPQTLRCRIALSLLCFVAVVKMGPLLQTDRHRQRRFCRSYWLLLLLANPFPSLSSQAFTGGRTSHRRLLLFLISPQAPRLRGSRTTLDKLRRLFHLVLFVHRRAPPPKPLLSRQLLLVTGATCCCALVD
jgi:hypothetical protein